MEDTESVTRLIAWLRLIRVNGLSPPRFNGLLCAFGNPQHIVSAEPRQLLMTGLGQPVVDAIKKPDWYLIEADLAWLEQPCNHLVTWNDPGYPLMLRQITDPPPALFVRGNIDVLASTQIAIVGSRKPTAGGRRQARDFAESLASSGVTITSGLATGIDSAAHQGALDAAAPTIAVLANGLDSVYPAVNGRLAEQICERGALISELPSGSRPLPQNFPKRNRIISGLSVGTLVVEAALKSGSCGTI